MIKNQRVVWFFNKNCATQNCSSGKYRLDFFFFVVGQKIQAEVAPYPLEDGSGNGYYCLTCGSRFRSKASAQRHFREIHSLLHQSQEVCPYCSKVYKGKRHLASHLRTSHGVRSSGKIFV